MTYTSWFKCGFTTICCCDNILVLDLLKTCYNLRTTKIALSCCYKRACVDGPKSIVKFHFCLWNIPDYYIDKTLHVLWLVKNSCFIRVQKIEKACFIVSGSHWKGIIHSTGTIKPKVFQLIKLCMKNSIISIYSLGDLGVSSNLIASLSWNNWALFTPFGVNNALSKQNKMAGINSHFKRSMKSTLNGFLQQMMRWSAVEITLCAYTWKYCSFQSWWIVAIYLVIMNNSTPHKM